MAFQRVKLRNGQEKNPAGVNPVPRLFIRQPYQLRQRAGRFCEYV